MPQNCLTVNDIPQDVIDDVVNATSVIATRLGPYLIALTAAERMTLPKTADKTIPFVEKTIGYTDNHPELVPPFMNLDNFRRNYTMHRTLARLIHPLTGIVSNMSDTLVAAGCDSFRGALQFYDSVRLAARHNVPAAQVIYEDLRQRFEGQMKKRTLTKPAKTKPQE